MWGLRPAGRCPVTAVIPWPCKPLGFKTRPSRSDHVVDLRDSDLDKALHGFSVIEDWIPPETALHVHVRIGSDILNGSAEQYRVLTKWFLSVEVGNDHSTMSLFNRINQCASGSCRHEVRPAVFVLVG